MPRTRVVFYRDDNGSVPIVAWLDEQSRKARVKCRHKIDRLRELGHELRRPESDYLRDGIYELRVRLESINYRILYFYHGNTAAVVSHGVRKERAVPATEIDRAVRCKERFEEDPAVHTYEEDTR